MFAASLGRGLLIAGSLWSLGCTDLGSLRRTAERAVRRDTAPEPESAPEPSRPKRQDSGAKGTGEAANFASIRRALRRLVVTEETFFAENGTYSDLSASVFKDKGVSLRFLWLSRDGWAASGTHADIAGKDCVIFVGPADRPPTTLKYVRSGKEGIPVCDDRSAPSKPVVADTAKAVPHVPDTANTLDLLDPRVIMKVDLRNLAHSQETYLRMQGIYARRTESMALQYLWHHNVRVKILSADAQSWAAKATDTRYPMKSCVIWFGPVPERPKTDAQQRVESRAGEPVCDD
jgi:hypothetical protein